MIRWPLDKIRRAVDGRWAIKPAAPDRPIAGLSTDTRTLASGQLFVALRGEFFDGHAFISQAGAHGAPAVLIDSPDALVEPARLALQHHGCGVITVASTDDALLELGAAYRRTLTRTRVVAVTGSAGKTTAVRFIDAALGLSLHGSASIKSFNNAIGVPLTILAADEQSDYLVCEIGMNAPGEIAELAAITAPDIAVITSIGRAHIGELGSIEAIAREKASLLPDLTPGGLAVVPVGGEMGGEYLEPYLGPVPQLVRFGAAETADIRIQRAHHTDRGTLAVEFAGGPNVELPLIGRHNAANAAAAVAVARAFNLDPSVIARGLARTHAPEMRFEPETIAGATIYNDAYNASPESVRAAIDTFAEVGAPAQRRVIVLGDMLELGVHAEPTHREIAAAIAKTNPPDVVIAIGLMAPAVVDELLERGYTGESAIYSELTPEIATRLAARLEPGDAVLVKGSRRLGLERLVTAARTRAGVATQPSTRVEAAG
ncbi:MAG: UDP-N-acetylmuramoyl-tripeptide--D-alanyl-D-alanine ligase [Planctomycetota bacterium]